MIKPEPVPRVPFSFQPPQFLEPPVVVTVHLLHRLVPRRVVHVSVELPARLTGVESVSDLAAVLECDHVVAAGWGVEAQERAIQRSSREHEGPQNGGNGGPETYTNRLSSR